MILLKTIYEKHFKRKVPNLFKMGDYEIKYSDIRTIDLDTENFIVTIITHNNKSLGISCHDFLRANYLYSDICEKLDEYNNEALKQSLRDEIRIQSDKDFFNT